MAFTAVTITQDFTSADQTEPSGTVTFTPSAPMLNSNLVVPAVPVVARLDGGGAITIPLYANTDTGTAPGGVAYLVAENINGVRRSYYISVPHNLGSTLTLYSLAQVAIAPAVSFPSAFVSEAPLSLKDPRVNCALDGTGDESAKVATAISLLPAGGGHIYQPPGILRTGAITFDRPVRWEGAGESVSTIKAASAFAGSLVTVSATATFSHISHVTFDGGGSALKGLAIASPRGKFAFLHFTAFATTASAAIDLNGVDSTNSSHANQFSNIRIVSSAGYGVYLRAFSYDNEFVNLWIGSCQVGVRIENTDCFFSNLHVWGSTGSGVEVRGANNRFSNVYLETNGSHGIDCFNAPRTKIANGSVWKNQGQGVNVSTSDRVSMIGLNIYDQGSNGVNGANSLYGQVIGCTFYDDTGSAQTQDRPVVTTGTSDKWIVVDNVMLTSEHATGASSLVGSNNILTNNITA